MVVALSSTRQSGIALGAMAACGTCWSSKPRAEAKNHGRAQRCQPETFASHAFLTRGRAEADILKPFEQARFRGETVPAGGRQPRLNALREAFRSVALGSVARSELRHESRAGVARTERRRGRAWRARSGALSGGPRPRFPGNFGRGQAGRAVGERGFQAPHVAGTPQIGGVPPRDSDAAGVDAARTSRRRPRAVAGARLADLPRLAEFAPEPASAAGHYGPRLLLGQRVLRGDDLW